MLLLLKQCYTTQQSFEMIHFGSEINNILAYGGEVRRGENAVIDKGKYEIKERENGTEG